MVGGSIEPLLLKDLQTLYLAGAVGGLTDGQLLDRFLAGGDGAAEAAFATLTQRHGPMVLRVCRQMLGDPHDVQDAFQATFLVFARKAGSVSRRDSVASWLHGVARRVAMRARSDAARRRTHERRVAAMSPEESAGASDRDESWPELHEEIGRLPERYRTPVVLCYLEGLTTEAAAQRLGCPQGTVMSRLSRARERLRDRLTRRGAAPAAALLAAGLSREADAAALSADLIETTVRVSLSFAGKRATAAALASTKAGALAGGVLFAMTTSKLKVLGGAALAVAVALGGVETFARPGARRQAGAAADAGERDRSMAKLQEQLAEATRRNAELQKDLDGIRKEIETLRAGRPAPGGTGPSPAGDVKDEPTKLNAPLAAIGRLGPGSFGGGPDRPSYTRHNNLVFVTYPSGDKFTIVDIARNRVRSIRLPGTKEAPLTVVPVIGAGMISLHMEGPKIDRVAVFSLSDWTWYTQDLREPVAGKVSPVVGGSAVVLKQGRYIYAFSTAAKRWGVLELPEGSKPSPVLMEDSLTVTAHDGQIDEFDIKTGEWKHTDVRAIIDAAIEAAEKSEGEKGDRPRN